MSEGAADRSWELSPERRRAGWAVLVVAATVGACWPVSVDMVRRLRAGIDEPWGLVALLTVVVLAVVRRGGAKQVDGWGWAVAWPLLVGSAVAWRVAPPLVGAILAMGAIAVVVSRAFFGRRMDWPVLGLLLLSLPVSSALQFYLGYPMRSGTAGVAAPMLQMGGLGVVREGTVLRLGERSIWIDAPCSGVKMLWAGVYLGMTLAAVGRLGFWRTVTVGVLAVGTVFVGNVVRSLGLFYIEAGLVRAPHWVHAGIGMVAFALIAMVIVWGVRRSGVQGVNRHPDPLRFDYAHRGPEYRAREKWAVGLHFLVCAAVAIVPALWPRNVAAAGAAVAFPGWPTEFEGRALVAEPLAERERVFLTDFPGRVGKFSDGRRQVILRWTPVATRKLHLSSDCFRGAGYVVTPEAAMGLSGGVRWSRFTAVRGGERLVVSERIYDAPGRSWPDASSWYWEAAMGRTRGPWWGVTVVERVGQ